MLKVKRKLVRYVLAILLIAFIVIITLSNISDKSTARLFPIKHYNQKISAWINPNDSNFNESLLAPAIQKKHLEIFLSRNFGALSPWNADNINLFLKQIPPEDLLTMEKNIVKGFSNGKNKTASDIGYGANFRPYALSWIKKISFNMNLAQLKNITYQEDNRAIVIDNLLTRALPTDDVFLYNHNLAGQGYPFDILQLSALWVGTPVYIFAESRDRAWMLVSTPAFVGWVKSSGIARVNSAFVNSWTVAANKRLAAITRTQTDIYDKNSNFLFTTYVGTFFPAKQSNAGVELMVPVRNNTRRASIETVITSRENAVFMPLLASPHNFSKVMATLVGRPYGWGNMYFYNDCSAELKNLFTPFGIWLPRHSSNQVTAGSMVDMSAASPENRLAYLMKNGQPFLTIVYIGGHVFLYIGNYPDPHNPSTSIAMTYQNMWGLSPKPAIQRAVVGQSVFFPLLLQYPENKHLTSLLDKKYFQISYLNQMPDSTLPLQKTAVNMRSLKHPIGF